MSVVALKHQWLWRPVAFAFYPALAVLMLCMCALVLACGWLAIPFGTISREGNKITLSFPWSKP